MTLFSVIIPSYNRLELLKAAVGSVWAQSYTDYEVIVVDDGSTDGTRAWLTSHGDRLTAVFQSNGGPGPARNAGAQVAKGDYLAFLDSDDVWFPWTLNVHARAIKEGGLPSLVSGMGARSHPTPPLDFRMTCYDRMLSAFEGDMPPVGGTPSVTVNRVAFERVGGFLAHNINAEDIDLWFRLSNEPGFVRLLSPPVFSQGYQDFSASRNHEAQTSGVVWLLEQESAGNYPGGPVARLARIQILAAMARGISLASLRDGHKDLAWRLYYKSIRLQARLLRLRYVLGFPIKAILPTIRKSSKLG